MHRYLGLLSIVWFCSVTLPAGADEIKDATDTFKSNNKDVTVERYEPKAEGKYPAIVVVHGSGGPGPMGGGFRGPAKQLAEKGFVVLYPYFFESTGWKPEKVSAGLADVRGWTQAVNDCVSYAAKLSNVDAKRIGVIGYSLGAFLALSAGGQNAQIAAVGEVYGNFPDALARSMRRTPPILILHGDMDNVVPVDNARKLEQFLKNRRAVYEVKIYAGAGHGFKDDDHKDATERTIAFFEKHLINGGK
jgi:carboxymethylenebutenolidase